MATGERLELKASRGVKISAVFLVTHIDPNTHSLRYRPRNMD